MKNFFKDCKTAEDVKKTFKELAKKLHPDAGGDAETFKAMMSEYKTAFERLKTVHATKGGETYTKETTETPEGFADIINKIIFFDDCTIEMIGSWIWVSGNTPAHREELKKAGFWWSKSKKAWYYNGADKKTKRRGRYTMEQLRGRWGSEEVKAERRARIAG